MNTVTDLIECQERCRKALGKQYVSVSVHVSGEQSKITYRIYSDVFVEAEAPTLAEAEAKFIKSFGPEGQRKRLIKLREEADKLEARLNGAIYEHSNA